MNTEEKILKALEQQGKMLERLHEAQTETQEKIAGMDERLTETQTAAVRAAVLLKEDVQPKLQLLYDGYQSIMEKLETLAPRNRVEALEDEMSFMKTVIRALSQEVAELKKAQ